MIDITLQALLEAGCHFGHKAERWHPKAADFIYTEKDGIHVIDLAQTKTALERAVEFVRELVAGGEEILFIGTKRQARGVVREAAETVSAPYLVERWIGGFLTNWDEVHKNIAKINRLTQEQQTGVWKKFPKHEQFKLAHYITKLNVYYKGVLTLARPPAALFVVDIKKEDASVREARRSGLPVVAIVDTNTDPTTVDYPIPANDDAVGSIQYITQVIAQAYQEGKNLAAKKLADAAVAAQKEQAAAEAEKAAPKEAEKIAEPAVKVEEKKVMAKKPAAKKPKSAPKKII